MAEPWQCPACFAWIAPHVTEHRCDGGGGVSAKVPDDPVGPTGSVSLDEMRTQAATVMAKAAVMRAREAPVGVQSATRYAFFVDQWGWSPRMVDAQPSTFVRWAPGVFAAMRPREC